MINRDKIKILILDDEKQLTGQLNDFFLNLGFQSFEANTAEEGRKIMKNNEIDLLILDIQLPGVDGLDVLREVKIQYPLMEVIIISAHGDMNTVIKAMHFGAFDYLRKPFGIIDIQMIIERTQRFLRLQRKLKRTEEKNSLISKALEAKIGRQLIGVSKQIVEVLEQAVTAANYPEAAVLITGESGTGKENIARIIHYSSARKDRIFCAVNSSSITETLLESEFFGHKKGSFTGAITDKVGFFEVCNEGTLFLDEITNMPLNLQAKILRATEEKVITRVGETKPIHTDFRIISATNTDIEKQVEKKEFRLDLFHRLNTLHIHIPALRERPEDIKPLLIYYAEVFAKKFNKPNIQICEEVFDVLLKYDFPGNVRELRNMTERALILCKSNMIRKNDFQVNQQKPGIEVQKEDLVSLKLNEIKMIRKTLQNSKYNQQLTASKLGISRDALIRKMRKYDISVSRSEGQ